MSVDAAKAKLNRSLKDLLGHWQRTRSDWNDVRSRQFEEKVITEIEMDVRSSLGALDRMGEVVRRVRRDCE
jgi:hypothetical protein